MSSREPIASGWRRITRGAPLKSRPVMDFSDFPCLTPSEEARQILQDHQGDYPAGLKVITEQFTKLQNRSQILLTVGTIALTVTGFSGSKIAATGMIPRLLIVSGLAFVLSGIVVLLAQTLSLKWATQIRLSTQEQTLEAILTHRNKKTQTYGIALLLVVIGLALHVSSVGFYLLLGTGNG